MSCRFTWCQFTVAEFKWYWGTQLSVVKGQTAIIGLCLVGGKMCRPLINHSRLKHRDWDRILKKQPNRSTVGLLAIQSCWQTSCWWQTWTTLGHLWVGLGIQNGVPSSTNSVDGNIWEKTAPKSKTPQVDVVLRLESCFAIFWCLFPPCTVTSFCAPAQWVNSTFTFYIFLHLLCQVAKDRATAYRFRTKADSK